MISFHPVCLKSHRHKDGSYPVKIRIYLNGKSRWLPTNISAYPSDLTRNLRLKPSLALTQANRLIRQMREAVAEFNSIALDQMTVDQAVDYIKRNAATFRLSFFDYAERFMAAKSAGTAECYDSAVKSFREFVGGDIDINGITTAVLKGYVALPMKSIPMYYNRLKTVYNAARMEYNDEDTGRILIPRNPFNAVKPQQILHDGQHSLDVSVIQSMIDCDDNRRRLALDLWLLSFALFGMNIADMYECRPPKNGWIEYERKKTRTRRADRARMRVRVPEQLSCIVRRLTLGAETNRWLSLSRRFSSAKNVTGFLSKEYAAYCRNAWLKRFSFYSARKSFATLARRAGVDKATIDECLCHVGDYRLADIYIDKDFNLLTSVQDKVLDFFQWKHPHDV